MTEETLPADLNDVAAEEQHDDCERDRHGKEDGQAADAGNLVLMLLPVVGRIEQPGTTRPSAHGERQHSGRGDRGRESRDVEGELWLGSEQVTGLERGKEAPAPSAPRSRGKFGAFCPLKSYPAGGPGFSPRKRALEGRYEGPSLP